MLEPGREAPDLGWTHGTYLAVGLLGGVGARPTITMGYRRIGRPRARCQRGGRCPPRRTGPSGRGNRPRFRRSAQRSRPASGREQGALQPARPARGRDAVSNVLCRPPSSSRPAAGRASACRVADSGGVPGGAWAPVVRPDRGTFRARSPRGSRGSDRSAAPREPPQEGRSRALRLPPCETPRNERTATPPPDQGSFAGGCAGGL